MTSTQERRVLIVDDNVDAANMAVTLLQLLGQAVKPAYDGPSALQIVATFAPDIVFLDLDMPGMDGFAVARRLRELQGPSRMKIVALTGLSPSPEFLDEMDAAGFDSHMPKPASASDFERMLA